jgi:putative hydrolase of the HAD superfamily
MVLDAFFIDLDDTVYPASSGIWPMIRQRIGQYMLERVGLSQEAIPELRRGLFEKYGTTLRGLQAEYHVDIEEYLAYVHDVPVEERLHPDPALRQILLSYSQPKFIFTNADARHAERVLAALQLRDCFSQIIDIHQIAPACKPQPYSFQVALKAAGWPNPRRCLFVDDAPHNLRAGRELGFFTVMVGTQEPNPAADRVIPRLCVLPEILPVVAGEN